MLKYVPPANLGETPRFAGGEIKIGKKDLLVLKQSSGEPADLRRAGLFSTSPRTADQPPTAQRTSNDFLFQVTTLDYNDYLGRICIGKIYSGSLQTGDMVCLRNEKGEESSHRVTKLFTFLGLKRIEAEKANAGDIVAIAGIPEMTIGDTLSNPENKTILPRIEIEPPTVSAQFYVNDSPFAGQEGDKVTSRNIRDRLEKELRTNLSLRVEETGDSFKVSARGELQIAILVENMRREGFELAVGRPQVIFREENGVKLEPYEEVIMDVPEPFSGSIIRELNRRRGQMMEMIPLSEETVRIRYEIPTRGMIGFQSYFLTETRGEGSLSSRFLEYRSFAGVIPGRVRGAIISMENGVANAYALFNLQDRGELFITPQTKVYQGMIIGLHAKETDLDVNPIKTKKLTNMRAAGSDDALKLTPPKKLTLEQALDFLNEDELLEVTPENLRLRKKILNPSLRKRKKAG
ncbi:MAG: translational GTPase TypA [Candidatus Hydrogenedentota bacterium]|nr:MAG: translational GTPase TypA [Candidatus Hydrogenedentota bacterium]